MVGARPWRVSYSAGGRTIYDANNILIGVMISPELAAQAVRKPVDPPAELDR